MISLDIHKADNNIMISPKNQTYQTINIEIMVSLSI